MSISSRILPVAQDSADRMTPNAGTHREGLIRSAWPRARPIPCALLAAGRLLVLAFAQGLIFAGAYLTSFLVRFEGRVPPEFWANALATLGLVTAIKLAVALTMGLQRGQWRDASLVDMFDVARSATYGTLVVVAARFLVLDLRAIPISVLSIDWAVATIGSCALRGSTRLARELWWPVLMRKPSRRVVIAGSFADGEVLAREIRRKPSLGMKVVGFLDSDHSARRRTRDGISVIGTPEELTTLVPLHAVQTILIPDGGLPTQVVKKILSTCRDLGVSTQVIPSLFNLLTRSTPFLPRDINLDDLLGRDSVELDTAFPETSLADKCILVTGAAGSIGSEICRQILALRPRCLILLDLSENGLFFMDRELRSLGTPTEIIPCIANITDAQRLRVVFEKFAPNVVLHAAAHKHVPLMESHPGEAIKNNVLGTRKLADQAVRSGVEAFVMISTDKAVNPISVMGACKRLAEMYVQSLAATSKTRMVTVRFGNVLGSAGSVLPIFQEQIRRGGPVTVTHPEMIRFFMTISEAARLVLHATALGKGGEIFVLDMGQPVKVLDLARSLIRMSGLVEGEDIQIVFTGLRPGEKLSEELYDEQEDRLPTPHRKIFKARHRPYSAAELRKTLDRLPALADGKAEAIREALVDLVPGFSPRSSEISPFALTESEMPSGASRSRESSNWPVAWSDSAEEDFATTPPSTNPLTVSESVS